MGLRLFSQKSNRTISRASALPVDAVSLGRLYIKILTAEDLDVPITKESPKLRCVVNDGAKEYATDYCAMKHTIQFKQEFYIDLNSLSDFTLTLQTEENVLEKTSKRFWGQNKGTKTDDLERYIHPRNRAIAQTRVSIQSIQSECSATIRSASLVLVNGWYRNVRSNFLSNKPKHPEGTQIREKAIGKIKVQLFFLPGVNSETEDLPNTMKACEQVMNIRRFYHTCWKKGYMYQLGGDVKYWKKQYYKLQGGYLFAYSDSLTTPRSVVDLSKVIALNVKLTPDASEYYSEPQTSIKDLPKDQNNNNIYQSNTYLMDDSRFVVNQSYNSNDRRTHEGLIFSLKNGFQCIFSNGEKMEFFCDLSLDHKQWTNILNTIIGRVPIWPIWLSKET
ncbi:hypothetical protein BDF14DRAFT_1352123 [Spinellus fusiger]|nr:hypothetical protein BDF14DRAFT_1352123 [Spinellus fusiger]